ncbi:MAG: response regulator transcription factor, partial [Pseudoflavonifractor sp.]
MNRSILIVEDDESIREMLRYYFTSVGYVVRSYDSAEALLSGELGQDCPLLCILDIMLPGMDGLELLRRLRADKSYAEVPVIFLTARTSEMDRVGGLELGADDYVVKPFGILELQARVKAVLRRTRREDPDAVLRCGDLEIDASAHVVRRGGTVVELTFKEFELLRLLASHRGAAMTRDEILQAVWDYDYTGETRTVDMHIKTLRQKIGEDYIQTIRGVG